LKITTNQQLELTKHFFEMESLSAQYFTSSMSKTNFKDHYPLTVGALHKLVIDTFENNNLFHAQRNPQAPYVICDLDTNYKGELFKLLQLCNVKFPVYLDESATSGHFHFALKVDKVLSNDEIRILEDYLQQSIPKLEIRRGNQTLSTVNSPGYRQVRTIKDGKFEYWQEGQERHYYYGIESAIISSQVFETAEILSQEKVEEFDEFEEVETKARYVNGVIQLPYGDKLKTSFGKGSRNHFIYNEGRNIFNELKRFDQCDFETWFKKVDQYDAGGSRWNYRQAKEVFAFFEMTYDPSKVKFTPKPYKYADHDYLLCRSLKKQIKKLAKEIYNNNQDKWQRSRAAKLKAIEVILKTHFGYIMRSEGYQIPLVISSEQLSYLKSKHKLDCSLKSLEPLVRDFLCDELKLFEGYRPHFQGQKRYYNVFKRVFVTLDEHLINKIKTYFGEPITQMLDWSLDVIDSLRLKALNYSKMESVELANFEGVKLIQNLSVESWCHSPPPG